MVNKINIRKAQIIKIKNAIGIIHLCFFKKLLAFSEDVDLP